MIPDLNFVRETFNTFNGLIFEGRLPLPRFSITKARTFRGKLLYKINRNLLGKKKCSDFELRISSSFNLDQEEWEDVVIHEMIHLLIASSNLDDTSPHGVRFKKIMVEINRKHSRNIIVSAKRNPLSEPVCSDKRVRPHFVCLARFDDGRTGMAPVAISRVVDLWERFKKFPGVASIKWIGTPEIWFNGFPHVRKPKFYLIDPEKLREHLKGARPLERTDLGVKVVNRHCSPDELLP